MVKKVCSLLLVFLFTFGLCSCSGGSSSVEITLKDGTVKNMTAKQLIDWKQEFVGRELAEFDEMMTEAKVSGSGTVVSAWVSDASSFSGSTRKGCSFPCKVKLDNGIVLDIQLKYGSNGFGYDNPVYNFPEDKPEIDIFEGDVLQFTGVIYGSYILEEEVEVRIVSTEIDEFEKVVGLEYIPDVQLMN